MKGTEKPWVHLLPTFLATDFLPLCKRVMHGKLDTMITGLLNHPPKGGFPMLTYKDHLKTSDVVANAIGGASQALKEWQKTVATRVDKDGGGSCQSGQAGGKSSADGNFEEGGESCPGGQAQGGGSCQEGDEARGSDAIKENMKRLAEEKRAPLISFAVVGNTATACRNQIRASGQFQKMVSGPPPHRVVFCYSVSDAYDRMPPSEGEYDRRLTTPSVVWTEDFSTFVEAVNPLVTATNQNVVAVLSGYNKRASSGLLTEAGLTNGHEIVNLVKKAAQQDSQGGESCSLPPWRVKSISLHMEEDSFLEDRVTQRKGTGGSLTQTLFFFYRGTWPSSLAKEARAWFGGSTWGDVWTKVKAPAVKSMPKIAIAAKRQIFEDAWAQLGASAKAAQEEEPGAAEAPAKPPPKKKIRPHPQRKRSFSTVTMTSRFGNSLGGSGSSKAPSSGHLAPAQG